METCDSAFTISVINRPDYEKLFAKIAKYALFYLAEAESDGNSIEVGYAALYANNDVTYEAYITLFCVRKEMQRTGVGSRLMDYCLEETRKRGMRSVRLQVLKVDIGAIQFYKHYGFKVTKEEPVFLFMVREL